MDSCPVEKNKDYIIDIRDIGNEGEGIGKIGDYTVFVKDALPHETVNARIIKIKKNFAFGKILEIISPSKSRINALCPVAKRCGGCTLQHLKYDAQVEFKTKKVYDALTRIGGFDKPDVEKCIGMENPYNYRNKAQFPVGQYKEGVRIGFYAGHSHEIIDTKSCMIQHKLNDRIIEIVRNFIESENITAYNEETGHGLIRHIMTRIGFYTGEILVCIVINGKKLPKSEKLIDKLSQIDDLKGIVVNINTENTNVILGHKNIVLWGRDYITDNIGNVKFNISVHSFYQVNPIQTKILYETALDYAGLTGNENVLDLYCGIGTISLFLAQKAKKVIGVEIVPQAIEDAKKNAEINEICNTEFICGASEDVVSQIFEKGFQADVIVVDPPRKGCDLAVLDTILKMKPKKVIYVSCDPATLARDLKILCEKEYEIKKIQPVDQFCFSTHVETVILMTRCGQNNK